MNRSAMWRTSCNRISTRPSNRIYRCFLPPQLRDVPVSVLTRVSASSRRQSPCGSDDVVRDQLPVLDLPLHGGEESEGERGFDERVGMTRFVFVARDMLAEEDEDVYAEVEGGAGTVSCPESERLGRCQVHSKRVVGDAK